MRPFVILLLPVLLLYSLLPLQPSRAATESSAPLLLDGVAAEVGAQRITIAETMLMAREIGALRQIPLGEQAKQLNVLYNDALEMLIERQLVLQAYEALKQKIPQWALDKRVTDVIEERFGGDRARLVERLGREGIGYDAWRKRTEEELIVSTMRQQFVDRNIAISPAAVRDWYATNQPLFKLDGNVRVGMILVAGAEDETGTDRNARAQKILERIRSGEDFKAVAAAESAEAHAATGGDWGFVDPEEDFRSEIATALRSLKVGEVSNLIETESGIYIVAKLDERPDGILPLADAWRGIEEHFRQQEIARRHRAWIESLKESTTVRRYPLP